MNYSNCSIVFYDGECGFCNRIVQLVLKYEKKNSRVYFSAIQSPFAQNFFSDNNSPAPDLSTFYFYTEHYLYTKSNAAIALSRHLKFPFNLSVIFRIIPVCQRDQLYDFVAKRRHKIAENNCVIPDFGKSERFLN